MLKYSQLVQLVRQNLGLHTYDINISNLIIFNFIKFIFTISNPEMNRENLETKKSSVNFKEKKNILNSFCQHQYEEFMCYVILYCLS